MRKQRTIGIISGKGGVGKTTTVANLGVVLAKAGAKTLVVDANLMTSNLGIHLNLLYPPATLTDCFKGEVPIKKIIYPHPSGLQIVPASIVVGDVLEDTLLKKVTDGIKEEFDYILFDSAPGVGTETIAVIKASSELIVITTPSLPSVSDAAKTVKIANDMGVPVLGVVINRVKGKKYELDTDEIEKMCGCSIIAEIPEDDKVPESIAFKNPVALYAPTSSAAKVFKTLGSDLTGRRITATRGSEKYTSEKQGILRRIFDFLLGR